MKHWNIIDGETFGQEERLTVRLRGLVRSYPRSVGIVKEFLQNADDAGATWLRVIWDERRHPRELLPDSRMAALQGPALLFASDQQFTDADFDAIRRIGESSKSELGPKTGRFGLGFNTAYNVTDYPSFVSRRWLVVFDPHRHCIDAEEGGTGRRWELADLWQFAPDTLAAFAAAGLEDGAHEYAQTIFRLPARGPGGESTSEICDEPFERQHFEQMLRDLVDAGDELLLFTRHVLEIRVERIDEDGTRHDLLRISTRDPDYIAAQRAIGNDAVAGDLADNFADWRRAPDELAHTTYRHVFDVVTPTRADVRPWQIAAGLFADDVGELLRLGEAMLRLREKALPWAGAAVRLELRDDGSAVVASQRGKLFCTFPLVTQPESLPCHLNGCFDLDASRRQISNDPGAYAEADRVRVAWNHALCRHALPQAAALAIHALVPDVAAAGPGRFYGLWPDPARGDELWRGFATALFTRLAELPLIRTRAGDACRWESLESTMLPPPLWGPDLQEALRDDGLRLPDPDIPARIVRSADLALVDTRRYRPGEFRDWLRTDDSLGLALDEAPRACLRERAHIVDLLQFCLSDRKDDIDGLPLALTADGALRTFGRAGELYLADDVTRRIFADSPAWFLDPGVQANTRLQPCPRADLHDMTPALALARLQERLSLPPGGAIAWDPEGEAIPNAAWLLLVLRYLTERFPPASAPLFADLALYPGARGQLHCADGSDLRIPTDDLGRELRHALDRIGVELVTGGHDVIAAIRAFQLRHPGPIPALTGPSLAARLPAVADALRAVPADARERAALVDYLAEPRWLDQYTPADLAALRAAPLLRTVDNRVVSADTPHVYLPGDFRPPALVDAVVEFVDLGPGARWRPLLDKLGVPEMRAGRYIGDILLPIFAALAPELQRAALLWLRDDVDLRALEHADPGLGDRLRSAPLIRARDGQLHPAAHLHLADDDAGLPLAGEASTPDFEFYRGDPARWRAFFALLGLRHDPRPDALLHAIDALIARDAHARDDARRGLDALLVFIHQRWRHFSGQSELAAGLRERAWLSPLRGAQVPGFVAPPDLLRRPDELYLPHALPLIASQGPVLAAPVEELDPDLCAALGFQSPTLASMLAHLDHLRARWQAPEHDGLDPARLGPAVEAIYAAIGSSEEHVPEDIHTTAARPCVWDPEHQRFWPPEHVFLTPVADVFGDLRGFVAASSDAVRTGLLRLGCRLGPDAGDLVAALVALHDRYGDRPLADADLALALRLLRRLADLDLSPERAAALLIPTREGRLRPVAGAMVDDAPWLSARVPDDALAFVHPRVPIELIERLGLPRLSLAAREQLAERPALSGNPDINHFCRQLTDTIHHPAFAAGVERILAHQGARASNLNVLGALRIVASDRIVTHLRIAGVPDPLGALEVPVFADADRHTVHVSGDHWDSVVVHIGEAIHRLLGNVLRDLAHIEAILRSAPDDIVTTLDHRRVPRLLADGDAADLAPVAAARPTIVPIDTRLARVETTPASQAPVDPDVMSAAIAAVVAHEREAGRSPRVTGERHPAFDVQSGEMNSPDVRFIRVVGLDGPWDRIPVVLGANHYNAGRTFGRNFWLYVVEHAIDPTRLKIHRLHDPVSRVGRFVLDHRWSAQGERSGSEMARYVGWSHLPPGGKLGIIESVESAGVFVWLHVRLADGQRERRFYKPGLDHLQYVGEDAAVAE